jgi:hypothetical protein
MSTIRPGAVSPDEGPGPDRMRGVFLQKALDHGALVWNAIRDGGKEDAENLAWYAWAYQEAAKASDLWKRWSELHEE